MDIDIPETTLATLNFAAIYSVFHPTTLRFCLYASSIPISQRTRRSQRPFHKGQSERIEGSGYIVVDFGAYNRAYASGEIGGALLETESCTEYG